MNVFVGSTFVYVCALMLETVVSVVLLNPPPPVVVNANEPSPPVVFLMRTMVDCFTLLNVQVVVPPAAIVDALNKETNAGLADRKIMERLADMGGMVLAGSPADFGKFIADETAKWAKVVKFAHIKAE